MIQDGTNPRLWSLRNFREEARSNSCKMTCFNLRDSSAGGADGEDNTAGGGDPPTTTYVGQIISKMCDLIAVSCTAASYPNKAECEQEITATNGFTQFLGNLNPPDYNNIGEVEQAEEEGLITANVTEATNCINSINDTNLDCNLPPMSNQVLPNVTTGDFSTTPRVLQFSPNCHMVFP